MHGGIVRMCICNDRRWPETYRVMGLQGVEMIVLGFNTPSTNAQRSEACSTPACAHDKELTRRLRTREKSSMEQDASILSFVNPPSLPSPRGYTQIVEARSPCRTVYISGQVGLDSTGKVAGAPGDFRAQAVQAFENLEKALAAVGGNFRHLAKINVYLIDAAAHFPHFLEVRERYVNREPPRPPR
jgi:enamine deaminase RidA (YjgF/YER057c/UK114 family)